MTCAKPSLHAETNFLIRVEKHFINICSECFREIKCNTHEGNFLKREIPYLLTYLFMFLRTIIWTCVQAFHIASCEHLAEDYIWKAATALISIYVFFTSERLLKCLLRGKEVS